MAPLATRITKRTANLMLVTESRILLLRRSRESRNSKRWGLPGGQREPGEHAWQAAARESLEEVGSLPRFELRDALSVQRKGKRCDIYVARVAEAELAGWHPRLNGEHVAFRWSRPRWCARRLKKLHPVLRLLWASELGVERVLRAMHGEVDPRQVERLLAHACATNAPLPARFALAA